MPGHSRPKDGVASLAYVPGHSQELGLQLGEFFVKVALYHTVQPNRPVM